MGKPPIKKIKSGSLTAAVWESEYEGKKNYSFTFQRSYKNKEGKWINTEFFKESDMGNLIILAQELAHRGIAMKEQQPQPAPQPGKDQIPF